MRRFFCCLLIVSLWVGVRHGEAQTPKVQKAVEKKLEKARAEQTALESLIAEALKNNPDIRVGESKMRDAEAELQRTRMKVLSEVTLLHTEIQAAQAAVEEAAARYERSKKLQDKGAVSSEELADAKQLFLKSKAALAVIQVKLPYLLGRPTMTDPAAAALLRWEGIRVHGDSTFSVNPADKTVTDEEYLRRITLDLLGRTPSPQEVIDFLKLPEKERREKWVEKLQKARGNEDDLLKLRRMDLQRYLDARLRWSVLPGGRKPESALTDKLRKALDAPVHLQMLGAAPVDVLDHVRDSMLPGVNLVIRAKGLKKDVIDIKLNEPVPLGALLQYLEDELGVVFVLRDYGIVVVGADERLPPGAVDVIEFWKGAQGFQSAGQINNQAKEKR